MRRLCSNSVFSLSAPWLACLLALCLSNLVQGVYLNMPTAEVLAEKGEPKNTLARGSSELWVYEDGTSLRFEGGLLVSCDGCVLTERALEPPAITTELAHSSEPTEPLATPNPIEGTESLEEAIVAYESEFDLPEMDDEDFVLSAAETTESHRLAGFLAGTFALSVILWLAFKYVGIGFLARQVIAIAMAFNLFKIVLDLVPWQYENRQFFYFDALLSLGVFVCLIYFLSEVKSALTALKIAIAAMIITRILVFAILWAALTLGGSLL